MTYYRPRVPGGSPTRAQVPPPPRRRPGFGSVVWGALFVVFLALLVFGGVLFGYVAIAATLPNPDELQARASSFASTQIYDRTGALLTEQADPEHGRRTAVKLDQISSHVVDATIATEDPNFYSHPGVDPVGIARAVYYAVRERDLGGPGGSTITQQLVKLTFLSPEKSISRKVKEAILAAEITRRYDKRTILEIYLNELNYGNLAYGIEAAAETYFGKAAKDLDLAESAMIAGLPQAPAWYDPYTKLWESDGKTPGLVKKRQGTVLSLMVRSGHITAEQADAAWKQPLKLVPLQRSYTMRYPHFVLFARSQVERSLGPELAGKGGLRIYTTVDPRIQDLAEQQVREQVARLAAQQASNAALVAVRPQTGEILAMVGSADFKNDDDQGADQHVDLAPAARLGDETADLPGCVRDARRGRPEQPRDAHRPRERHRVAGRLDTVDRPDGYPDRIP